jgi:hypothetical protein
MVISVTKKRRKRHKIKKLTGLLGLIQAVFLQYVDRYPFETALLCFRIEQADLLGLYLHSIGIKPTPVKIPRKVNGGYIRQRILIGKFTTKEWQDKLKEYNFKCAYCGTDRVKMTKDHLVPVSRGGTNTIDNIVPACLRCNMKKSIRFIHDIIHLFPNMKLKSI